MDLTSQSLRFQEINADAAGVSVPIMLLHGLFGMSDNLMGSAKSLAESHPNSRIIVPDLINHGHSPHRGLMDYPAMAADVLALMDRLEVSQAHIMGHSMGGKVAMQCAMTAPQRVASLVIADVAPVTYGARHLEILQAMQKVAAMPIIQRREAEAVLAEFVPEVSLRQFFLKNMARDADNHWRWRFGLDEISAAYADICAAPQLTQAYTGRTLLIKGSDSDYVLPEHAEVIQQFFPQLELKVIDGAGHWLHAEKPLVFNRLLQRFLA